MSDDTQLLTGAIDDYLLGLADGLQKAQRQLNQLSTGAQPGDSPIVYQIPRIDFELKMTIEVNQANPTDGRGAPGGLALRFRPATAQRTNSAVTSEAVSVIRGSFVAVPVRGGKPPPTVRSSLRRIDARKLEVTVSVQSAVGEKLAGVPVNFNVDRELSRTLTEAKFDTAVFDGELTSDDKPLGVLPGTGFWDGLVETDQDGIAISVLSVDPQQQAGTRVAMIVDVLSLTETTLFVTE